MVRKSKSTKPLIYVFYEGESERAYSEYLKKVFSDVAVLKFPSKAGLFDEAYNKFKKEPKYADYIEQTDEIWFFFDVERNDLEKWDSRLNTINKLRKLKRKPGIKIRLLMTTGCIEYWLMLHYQKYAPALQTPAEKNKVFKQLKQKEPSYEKGDRYSTAKIAENYPTAVRNAKDRMEELSSEGLPGLEDSDKRNEWLYKSSKTFSTVYEAIVFLESLVK